MPRADKKSRLSESEDSAKIIEEKCFKLAELIRSSKCAIAYTGAGISTAASIPDYRGPSGLWTLAKQGKIPSTSVDPISSSPTTAHIVLKELCRSGLIKHVVSQNCDGLHLRSGIPQRMLSEIHGNTNVEVCPNCDKEYIRNFDVTVNSEFERHATGRNCASCSTSLVDTIVYFGEKRAIEFPLNWKGILTLIPQVDLIICFGTSLQVLRHYKFLWPKHAKLAIVNLQWTPKDNKADLKINGRCDDVMIRLANLFELTLSFYCRDCDPVNQPRRNARLNEIMDKFTDCNCHRRPPRPLEMKKQEVIHSIRKTRSKAKKLAVKLPKWMTVPANKAMKVEDMEEIDEESDPEVDVKIPKKRGRKRKIKPDVEEELDLKPINMYRGTSVELLPNLSQVDVSCRNDESHHSSIQTNGHVPKKRGRKPKKRRGRKPNSLILQERMEAEICEVVENMVQVISVVDDIVNMVSEFNNSD